MTNRDNLSHLMKGPKHIEKCHKQILIIKFELILGTNCFFSHLKIFQEFWGCQPLTFIQSQFSTSSYRVYQGFWLIRCERSEILIFGLLLTTLRTILRQLGLKIKVLNQLVQLTEIHGIGWIVFLFWPFQDIKFQDILKWSSILVIREVSFLEIGQIAHEKQL